MPNVTSGARPDADVSPKNIARIEAEIPDIVRTAAVDISSQARALAWLSFELLEKFRMVNDTVKVLIEADRFDNSGDLTNAVIDELGLNVAMEVFDGLHEAFRNVFDDMRCREETARVAARHGRDHYNEIGKPEIISSSDGLAAELDMAKRVLRTIRDLTTSPDEW